MDDEEMIKEFIRAEEEKINSMSLKELYNYLKDVSDESRIIDENLRVEERNIYVLRQEIRSRQEKDKSGVSKKEFIELFGEEDYMKLYDQ